MGVAREEILGQKDGAQWREEQSEDGRPRRVGWRKGGVWWGDGLVAGGLLGVAVGALCEPLSSKQQMSGQMTDGANR